MSDARNPEFDTSCRNCGAAMKPLPQLKRPGYDLSLMRITAWLCDCGHPNILTRRKGWKQFQGGDQRAAQSKSPDASVPEERREPGPFNPPEAQ